MKQETNSAKQKERWRREQLHNVVLGAAGQLDLYVARWLSYAKDLGRAQQDPEIVRLSSEAKKCLLAILMYYHDKRDSELAKLSETTRKANWNAILKEDEAWELRQSLISLALAVMQ